jgi:hypothetical protein
MFDKSILQKSILYAFICMILRDFDAKMFGGIVREVVYERTQCPMHKGSYSPELRPTKNGLVDIDVMMSSAEFVKFLEFLRNSEGITIDDAKLRREVYDGEKLKTGNLLSTVWVTLWDGETKVKIDVVHADTLDDISVPFSSRQTDFTCNSLVMEKNPDNIDEWIIRFMDHIKDDSLADVFDQINKRKCFAPTGIVERTIDPKRINRMLNKKWDVCKSAMTTDQCPSSPRSSTAIPVPAKDPFPYRTSYFSIAAYVV